MLPSFSPSFFFFFPSSSHACALLILVYVCVHGTGTGTGTPQVHVFMFCQQASTSYPRESVGLSSRRDEEKKRGKKKDKQSCPTTKNRAPPLRCTCMTKKKGRNSDRISTGLFCHSSTALQPRTSSFVPRYLTCSVDAVIKFHQGEKHDKVMQIPPRPDQTRPCRETRTQVPRVIGAAQISRAGMLAGHLAINQISSFCDTLDPALVFFPSASASSFRMASSKRVRVTICNVFFFFFFCF